MALKVADLTGEGVPEVAVWKMEAGGNWATTHLDVFTLRGCQLVKLTGFSSSDLIWIEDLNHDGRFEIGTWQRVGQDMLHWARPRWGDVYTWKNDRYVLADRDFPGQYRGADRDLLAAAKEYPDDAEVREYLGLAREMERRPRAALAAYRAACFLYRRRPYWYAACELQTKLHALGLRMAAARVLIRRHGRRRA